VVSFGGPEFSTDVWITNHKLEIDGHNGHAIIYVIYDLYHDVFEHVAVRLWTYSVHGAVFFAQKLQGKLICNGHMK